MYHLPIKKVTELFAVNELHGLSSAQIKKQQEEYGLNQLSEKNKHSALLIFLKQFTDPLVIVLFGAVIFSSILKEYTDAIVIVAILLINACLGFVQEWRAENAIAMLKKLTTSQSRVLRNGKQILIPVQELVPGDIVLLEAGDKIIADIRIIEATRAFVDESILTGESATVSKAQGVLDIKTPLAEQSNMLFSGTILVAGKVKGIVVATGMNTELGKIATMVQDVEEGETPLQKNLKKLGIQLGMIILGICIIVLGIGYINQQPLVEMIFIAIGLAVSAIPEGLPMVVTITLALGVQQLFKKNVLIKKLKAIETLGSTKIICTDKTGTITKNQMKVVEVFVNTKLGLVDEMKKQSSEERGLLREIAAHCNDARLPNIGDPTELALLEVAIDQGIEAQKPRIDEEPFSSEKKYMITVHHDTVYIKGSPEAVIAMCNQYQEAGKIRELNDLYIKTIEDNIFNMSQKALRVLAFAYKKPDDKGFVFVGMVGMIDPPRDEVREAILECKRAGIRVVMITGDNKYTAKAIADEVGIFGDVMTGQELDEIENLSTVIHKVSIYARVNPEHKVKILEALQKTGAIVAMTGDGVNDAPAIKRADVGVAMAKKGTDVAREAADMVLLDDNFASIVSAVRFGRIIYDNIKKCVSYLLSVNFIEIIVISIALIAGLPLPMLPLQILWINLVTDSLPAIALSFEQGDSDVMRRKPRESKEHILSKTLTTIGGISLLGTIIVVFVFSMYQDHGIEKSRTMAVFTSVLFQLLMVFVFKNNKDYIWKGKRNTFLVWSVIISLGMQIGVVSIPFLRNIFGFTILNLGDIGLIITMVISGLVITQIWIGIKKYLKSHDE